MPINGRASPGHDRGAPEYVAFDELHSRIRSKVLLNFVCRSVADGAQFLPAEVAVFVPCRESEYAKTGKYKPKKFR